MSTSDLVIVGSINDTMVEKLLQELQQPCYERHHVLRLLIHSPGGSLSSAMAMAGLFNACFKEIHTYNLAAIDSAAICLYLIGHKRFATVTAHFHLHPLVLPIEGNKTIEDLEAALQGLKADMKCITEFYSTRTGLPREKVKKLLQKPYLLTTKEALELGFVTEPISGLADFHPHYIGGN